jgi:hypothetical protein
LTDESEAEQKIKDAEKAMDQAKVKVEKAKKSEIEVQ